MIVMPINNIKDKIAWKFTNDVMILLKQQHRLRMTLSTSPESEIKLFA